MQRCLIVEVADAKARLSELIQRAEAGETVIIARDKQPAVQLIPVIPF
ncbi:MAG: type II toxin-antitoxin system Phd/YefM family antitoxin [Candidatus Competibacterales bacterium]